MMGDRSLGASTSQNHLIVYSLLVDKIDSDNDQKVAEHEMVAWIKYIQRRYVKEDASRQWVTYGMKDGDGMKWEYYQNRTYGTLTGKSTLPTL